MRKVLFLLTLGLSLNTYAKKVKFAVDMSSQVVSANGMHISGDFQIAAGYPANDDPATTALAQEGTSSVYSIVVDIPAFQKYEYRFINGDQGYESEFIPVESRVGYQNNDNRWIYVDSLGDDTTSIGAVLFGDGNIDEGNAPAGKFLVRFKVNMQTEIWNTMGTHVAGNFQGWDTQTAYMYSFADSVYEYIAFVDPGAYEFKYYNGNIIASTETVPSGCATNNNRAIIVNADTVLPAVCFSSCDPCVPAAIHEVKRGNQVTVSPNPAEDFMFIRFQDKATSHDIRLFDISGRVFYTYLDYKVAELKIDASQFPAGFYLLKINSNNQTSQTVKVLVQ